MPNSTIEDLFLTKNGNVSLTKTSDTDVRFRPFPFQMHRYPTSFQATDCVIIHREAGKILLGKKPNQPKWRFLGGFVDPKDDCLEAANARERQEEAGLDLECSKPEYLFSFRVEDPRYNDKPDKIMSAVFLSYFLFGRAVGGDDIKTVRWFTKDYIRRNYAKAVMPEHHVIVKGLIERGIL